MTSAERWLLGAAALALVGLGAAYVLEHRAPAPLSGTLSYTVADTGTVKNVSVGSTINLTLPASMKATSDVSKALTLKSSTPSADGLSTTYVYTVTGAFSVEIDYSDGTTSFALGIVAQ